MKNNIHNIDSHSSLLLEKSRLKNDLKLVEDQMELTAQHALDGSKIKREIMTSISNKINNIEPVKKSIWSEFLTPELINTLFQIVTKLIFGKKENHSA